jgi:hypothetical protein
MAPVNGEIESAGDNSGAISVEQNSYRVGKASPLGLFKTEPIGTARQLLPH